MEQISISIQHLDQGVDLPSYAHPMDAGADLRSTIDVSIEPGERALIPTGIAIALPEGYVGLVHPRSGLATKYGISIVNAPGTVDAGYRGEIKVTLINLDPRETFHVSRGDRIAQLVIQHVAQANFEVVQTLEQSVRGSAGFGSTGGFTQNS